MRSALVLLGVFSLAWIAGCGSGQPLLNVSAQSEAESMKSVCMENAIQSDEVIRGDSLFASGTVRMKKGDRNGGLADLDMAALYYKLAVVKRDLAQEEASIQDLERSLKETRQKLESYKKVVQELENTR
jgi:hypothetical protein